MRNYLLKQAFHVKSRTSNSRNYMKNLHLNYVYHFLKSTKTTKSCILIHSSTWNVITNELLCSATERGKQYFALEKQREKTGEKFRIPSILKWGGSFKKREGLEFLDIDGLRTRAEFWGMFPHLMILEVFSWDLRTITEAWCILLIYHTAAIFSLSPTFKKIHASNKGSLEISYV